MKYLSLDFLKSEGIRHIDILGKTFSGRREKIYKCPVAGACLVCFVVKSLSHVQLFATPWTIACQAPLSSIISRGLLKFMSIELVMLSNHLILCHPLLLLPSVFHSFRVFSNELALCIRWSKYWSFSFSNSPSNEYSGLISFRTD